MAEFTQTNRRLQITTPLGPDALVLTSFSGQEGMSRLFAFEAELLGRDPTCDFDKIVGKNVTVSILMSDGQRYINGVVSRFSQSGTVGDNGSYRAQIVPWFWLLTRTTDCRIFQDKTVEAIIEQIFKEYDFIRDFGDFKFKLGSRHPEWDYCVQYRETDFNFISRLLEEEGIFYFFEHRNGSHTLVLSDDPSQHKPAPGMSALRFEHAQVTGAEEDVVSWFGKSQEVRASKYSATDYNMETPALDLLESATGKDKRKFELYDYPATGGAPAKRDEVARIVKVRQQEEDTMRVVFDGGSSARSLTPGYTFDLRGVGEGTVDTFDGKYLLTSVSHRAAESWAPGEGGAGASYENDFQCIPASVPFRPARRTPKPVINGVQTAVVVGPKGEEICVDKYGRVIVHFFWDREDKRDEKSSCWVRVSQGWAGKNWGMVTIPRIGQEVVVSFLEGDPDCPLITGRVYNADQMPPYELPANMTQSGIKSRSSKGGSTANFNEIRMEDKKGSEELYFHAEKDENHIVENDQSLLVGRDKLDKIERDKTIQVARNHLETIDGTMTTKVASHQMIQVGSTLTETVAINYSETVGAAMELTVGAVLAITVGAAMSETVGGASSESIGGSKTLTTGGDLTEKIGSARTVMVGKDVSETIEGQHTEKVAKEYILKAKKIQLVAEDEISVKTGDASLTLKKNGNIELKGGKIKVEGSGDVVLKGSKIKEN
jgi:type VI secretion system secreted protein VgrG